MNYVLPTFKNGFKDNVLLLHPYLLAYLVLIKNKKEVYNIMGTTKYKKENNN